MKIVIDKDIVKIYVTNREEPAIVDIDDYDKIKGYNWVNDCRRNNTISYSKQSNGKRKFIKLHRLILGIDDKKILVDHINGDVLDNRKSNLKVVTAQQNMFNRKKSKNCKSGFNGVRFRHKKWVVQIGFNGKCIHIGQFDNINEAIKARKEAEEKYFGDYRRK